MCIMCSIAQAKVESEYADRTITADEVEFRYRDTGFHVDPSRYSSLKAEGGYDGSRDERQTYSLDPRVPISKSHPYNIYGEYVDPGPSDRYNANDGWIARPFGGRFGR